MDSKTAVKIHSQLPPDYYERSIRTNPLQWFWHKRRFQNVSRIIEPVKGSVLDIGSADGTFTEIIARKSKAKKIFGIDILKRSVDYANNKFEKAGNMHFMVGDAHKLSFPENSFDAVFCLEAMEHFINPIKVLKEIKRVLKSGGYLVILVPTDSLLFLASWWVVLHTWGKHWQETHIQSFNSKNSLSKLIEKSGFEIEKDKIFMLGMLEVVKAHKL